ncbi:MAG: hypothetical protein WC003_02875 [Terrimicrobiaceae bacterium]|jgi:hypothetical protein
MEQVVIIAIIGLISLVNWLMKTSAQIREERKKESRRLGIPEGDPYHQGPGQKEPAPDLPPPPGPPSDDLRRLMEALGIPADDEALPPEPPARDPGPVAAPPLPAFQPPPPRPNPRAEKIPAARPSAVPVPVSPLAASLRSQVGIRQAIILREILGPPKAFTI